MFSYITYFAVALKVAAIWGCDCGGWIPPCDGYGSGYLGGAGIIGRSGGLTGTGLRGGYGAGISGVYAAGIGNDLIGDSNIDSGIIGNTGLFGKAGLIGYSAGLVDDVAASGLYDSGYHQCIRHQVEPVVRPVVDECMIYVPVIKKNISHKTETITRQVPVVDRLVTQQEGKYIRHVPVTKKLARNVVEFRTRHVPIVKSRTRTVVEPYTTHVPITEECSRTLEETITKHVPIVERRSRPIVLHSTRLVPVTEKRIRPVVESQCVNVPVKNVVEQRVRAVSGPCLICPPGTEFGSAYPAGLSGAYGTTGLGLNLGGAYPGNLPTDLTAYAGLPAGYLSLGAGYAGGLIDGGLDGHCHGPNPGPNPIHIRGRHHYHHHHHHHDHNKPPQHKPPHHP